MKIGYTLMTEQAGANDLVRFAAGAEQAGFDFEVMSDHYFPWLDAQGHSPYAWSVLGAIAAGTDRIGLATGVTCPTIRYHPAIVAQAAATLGLLSDNRFTLGIGAGENLNEHVVGLGYPSVRVRHEMLAEALEIIRRLWSGGYQSYEGQYLQLDDARVYDLPAELPKIVVAAGGPEAAKLAAEFGDGLFATEPRADLVQTFEESGGAGPKYAEAALAWAPDEKAAVAEVLAKNAWAVTGWKVMSELPNPVNFEAAAKTVREEDIRESFAVGADAEVHVDKVRAYADAGFDHIVLMNAGPDVDGFLDFFASDLKPRLTTA